MYVWKVWVWWQEVTSHTHTHREWHLTYIYGQSRWPLTFGLFLIDISLFFVWFRVLIDHLNEVKRESNRFRSKASLTQAATGRPFPDYKENVCLSVMSASFSFQLWWVLRGLFFRNNPLFLVLWTGEIKYYKNSKPQHRFNTYHPFDCSFDIITWTFDEKCLNSQLLIFFNIFLLQKQEFSGSSTVMRPVFTLPSFGTEHIAGTGTHTCCHLNCWT